MLVMMLVGVVLIPVRASQLYSRLSERWGRLYLAATHKTACRPVGTCSARLWLVQRAPALAVSFCFGIQSVAVAPRYLHVWLLACRLLVAGHKPGAAPGCAGGYVVLSGRLSDVRGFNDFLTDWLVQVRPFQGGGLLV